MSAICRRQWQPDEDAKLCLMRSAGMTFHEASQRLPGRTAAACHNRYYALSASERSKPVDLGQLSAVLGGPDIALQGEPVELAIAVPACARCGVREDRHHEYGCGQFALELRVRERHG